MADELDANYLLDNDDDGGGSIVASEDEAAEGVVLDDQDGSGVSSIKENKKRKRKLKDKLRKQKRAAISDDYANGVGSVACQPPDMQADYLSRQQRKTFSQLTHLELNDIRISQAMLLDTCSFQSPRTLDTLPHFVRTYMPNLPIKLAQQDHLINTNKASPALILLTGNALRAADIARSLRSLDPRPATLKPPTKRQKTFTTTTHNNQTPSFFTVAKLFARHFKLQQHIQWLADHVTPIAVGTPQRVQALITAQALHLDCLEALIIDQTWVDPKQRTIFDTPETRDELLKLIAIQPIISRLRPPSSSLKLLLF